MKQDFTKFPKAGLEFVMFRPYRPSGQSRRTMPPDWISVQFTKIAVSVKQEIDGYAWRLRGHWELLKSREIVRCMQFSVCSHSVSVDQTQGNSSNYYWQHEGYKSYYEVFKIYFFFNLYVCRVCYVCGEGREPFGRQKRLSGPLELEFQVHVSCLVWMLRSKPDLLEQNQVPLPAEPSLWSCVTVSWNCCN